MFKSKDVACAKPSSFCGKSCVLGNGHGCLLILLFESLKSERNFARLFFFGLINVGAAHSDLEMFLLSRAIFRVDNYLLLVEFVRLSATNS